MLLYRVEIVEKDVIKDLPAGFRDVARISSPAYTIDQAIEKAKKLMLDFKKEIEQDQKYYINIFAYTIETEDQK